MDIVPRSSSIIVLFAQGRPPAIAVTVPMSISVVVIPNAIAHSIIAEGVIASMLTIDHMITHVVSQRGGGGLAKIMRAGVGVNRELTHMRSLFISPKEDDAVVKAVGHIAVPLKTTWISTPQPDHAATSPCLIKEDPGALLSDPFIVVKSLLFIPNLAAQGGLITARPIPSLRALKEGHYVGVARHGEIIHAGLELRAGESPSILRQGLSIGDGTHRVEGERDPR